MRNLIVFLLFFCHLLYNVTAITCNQCITKKIFNTEQPCSTCSGTQCYILEYSYKYESYKGKKAYEMDCITTSGFKYNNGCRQNKEGHVLCICDTDKCNEERNLIQSSKSNLPLISCHNREYSSAPQSTCTGHRCSTVVSNLLGTTYLCEGGSSKSQELLLNFDVFSSASGLTVPSNMCVYVKTTDSSSEIQCSYGRKLEAAVFEVERKISCLTETPTSYEETTCNSNLCYASTENDGKSYYGCFSYANSTAGITFKPGLHQVGINKFFLCDTDMCNKQIDSDGNKRKPKEHKEETISLGISCNCPQGCSIARSSDMKIT